LDRTSRVRALIVPAMAAMVVLADVPLTGLSAAGAPGPIPAPPRGALFGAYVNASGQWSGNEQAQQDVISYEKTLGRKLDINHHYYSWTDTFPSGLEEWDIQSRRTPLITWEPWGTDLRSIAEGQHDELIRTRARRLAALGAPVFLRWGHEPNSDWYPWSGIANNDPGTTNGPARYVAAYRRIHDLFEQEGARNVTWVWSPNAEDVPAESWNHWMAYYPGDNYVDWVGPDGYNWGTSRSWSTWTTFAEIFRDVYRDFEGRKPIMIAETASVEPGGSKAAWILDAWYEIQVRMPQIAAFVYFDVPPEWTARSSREASDALSRLATSSHFMRAGTSPRIERLRVIRGTGDLSNARVRFQVSEPAQVHVRVRGAGGGEVRVLRRGWAPPRPRTVIWRLEGRRARSLAPGRYLLELMAGNGAGRTHTEVRRFRLAG
jgi:hypothetical protein